MSRRRTSVALTAGAVAVGAAIGTVAFILWLASRPGGEVRLGPDTFVAGRAASLARRIDTGGPVGFKDPLGGDRNIWIAHLGGRRFAAFEDRLPGGCRLVLRRGETRLRDSCTGAVQPLDPPTPRHYRVTTDAKGRVVVDLRSPLSAPARAPGPR
jgi:hypothetical protein